MKASVSGKLKPREPPDGTWNENKGTCLTIELVNDAKKTDLNASL